VSSSSGTRRGARPPHCNENLGRRAILKVAMRLALTRFTARLTASALLFCGAATATVVTSPVDPSALPDIGPDTSLLVVSPHPDDETICCGGVIQEVVRAGGRVTLLWLTSGDAARVSLILTGHSLFPGTGVARELGARRMGEAVVAAARLGVARAGQLFLGYPDGGLQELLGAYRTTPYTSPSASRGRRPCVTGWCTGARGGRALAIFFPACRSPRHRSPSHSHPWRLRSIRRRKTQSFSRSAPTRRRCASWRRFFSRSCAPTSCSRCAPTSIRGRHRRADAHG